MFYNNLIYKSNIGVCLSIRPSVRPGPETHIPKKVPGSKRKKSSLCNFLLLSWQQKKKKNTARSLCNFLLLSLAAKGKFETGQGQGQGMVGAGQGTAGRQGHGRPGQAKRPGKF
jgi:hypothetical protein